jgi:hypothetical protein
MVLAFESSIVKPEQCANNLMAEAFCSGAYRYFCVKLKRVRTCFATIGRVNIIVFPAAMPPWQASRAAWLQAHNGQRSI